MSTNSSTLLPLNIGAYFSSSCMGVGLADSLLTNRICKWSQNCLLPFWALFLLWTTHCAGSQWPHGEDTLKPCRAVPVLRNEGPCLQPARDWDLQPMGMWVSHPGNESSSPRQAFIWLWPQPVSCPRSQERPWTRITWLKSSQIHYVQKMCEINICCFKSLSLGLSGYAAINK